MQTYGSAHGRMLSSDPGRFSSSQGLLDPDHSRQFEWHETYRDGAKNMYRTSYADMVHGREVAVKSDYPSGYGGHIRNIRHDILFRNMEFDRTEALKRADPSRDAHPSFKDQISGIPTWCAKPQGAKKHPTFRVVPHKASTTDVRPPWAVVRPVQDVPKHRNTPTTLARARSSPSLLRSNDALMASGQVALAPSSNKQNMSKAMGQMSRGPVHQSSIEDISGDVTSPAQNGLKRTVAIANQEARKERMPTEAEMLMQEMGV